MIFPFFVALVAALPFAVATPVPEPGPNSLLNPTLSPRSLKRLPSIADSKAVSTLPRWLVNKDPSEFRVKKATTPVRGESLTSSVTSDQADAC
jgi:hypothetical protein